MSTESNIIPIHPEPVRKARPRRRTRRPKAAMAPAQVIVPAAPQGVMAEVKAAFQPRHLLSTSVGVVFGGAIPLATYMVSHSIRPGMPPVWMGVAVTLTALGLLFSLPTVYVWGRQAFGAGYKALGFAGLAEGIMVTADHIGLGWMSVAMLVLLVFVNSVSCGTGFAFYRPNAS